MQTLKVYEVIVRGKSKYVAAFSKKEVLNFFVSEKPSKVVLRKDIDVDDKMLKIN